MSKIDKINQEIKELKFNNEITTKDVSDVYHTFRDLYRHRTELFCVICNTYSDIAWKSKKHFDEENDPMFDGDFIAGIDTPLGVAAYHMKLEFWDKFNVKEIDRAPKYDGYKGDDVIIRLSSLNEKNNYKQL